MLVQLVYRFTALKTIGLEEYLEFAGPPKGEAFNLEGS